MVILKQNRRKILLTLLTVGFIAVIFGNSLQPASVSSTQSGSVVRLLQSAFSSLEIPLTVTSFMVRKTAHFLEYTVLGVLLGVTLRAYTPKVFDHVFAALFVGLAVPVTDECIQLFVDGRAGMVQDVILDFAGVLTGLGLILLTIAIKNRRVDWLSDEEKSRDPIVE